MKEHFYEKADIAGGSPVFLMALIALILLFTVLCIRQMSFLPPDKDTLSSLVLNESKSKANSFKKYFPKPYSVQDLARGDL